jgi:site-specific DNA recombinase
VRAFGYVRLSKLDEKSTSPRRQREVIERLCSERGWELVKVYEDLDVSGYAKNGKRPGLDRMLSRLDEVDAIVFWKLDRLARGVAKFYGILQQAEAANVALVSTAEPFDTSSPMGRAMVGITAIFAELESDVISERSRAMHRHLREQGRWVGRVPFGWRLEDGKLVGEPKGQAVLREAAERYIAGESLRLIAADIGWHHVNLARALRTDRVLDALPRLLAGRLAREMAERGREGTRAKRSLLGGIARCAVCGEGMTVAGSRRWTDGRQEYTPRGSYVCRKQGHVSISRSWLDEYVAGQVIASIDAGELVRRIERRGRKRSGPESSELEARLELLERDHYERGIIPRDRYLRRREGILRRLKEARDAEEDAGIELPVALARDLSNTWERLSVFERRRILSAVLERVDVKRAKGHGKIDPARVRLVWRAA